jgi:hypothetical protein
MALVAAAAPAPAPEHSVEAAAAVVRAYYAAVERKDYRAAYRYWNGGRSLAAFRQGYAQTRWVRVETLPPYRAEGGAGSIYCEVRVRVQARLKDGTPQRFAGSYTLRRVNDVDGSTPEQRRWHIIQATLKPVPAGA